MRAHQIGRTMLLSLLASDASAQLQSARPPVGAKVSVTRASGAGPGGFLGSDACTSPHTPAGSGSVAGVPFTTGTAGTEGQNEVLCLSFSTTVVDNDVWYDWTCTNTGNATVSTCAGTTVDTKIAAYPHTGSANCPADGTALACSDDACGFQSQITWSVNSGAMYTIQVGTFPGASGGGGTFDITESLPPPCGQYDDGTSENSLGLTVGGEIAWLHSQLCLQTVDSVETAYGTASMPGALGNGAPASIHVYEDADCDQNPTTPAFGMTVKWTLATTVTNVDTDILNNYPAPMGADVNIASNCSWVMATCTHSASQFPAPMDTTNPVPQAWVAGDTVAPMDTGNLNNNPLPPLQIGPIGFPAAWLLRGRGDDIDDYCKEACEDCYDSELRDEDACDICWNPPCTPFERRCFGDGTAGTSCPCGNPGDSLGGCNNSLGSGGAILGGSGTASLSADSLVLTATRTPNQPGIFFQGDDNLAVPPTFGDGLRCCGVNVLRLGTYLPAGNTTNTSTGIHIGGNLPPISDIGANAINLSPGESRCYQWWYRDPSGPCGFDFNTSNAIGVTWSI